MHFRRVLSPLAGLLAAAFVFSACAPAATPTPQIVRETVEVPVRQTVTVRETVVVEVTPTALPEPQGELTVYTTRAESLFKPVIEAFNAAYPKVKVTVLSGSNSELAAKILEEQKNPVADVFINSDTLTMIDLASKGVFQPNDSPAVTAVPPDYRAEDGSWVALTLRARVIMYNTELVSPDEAPKSIFDLTDPKWKGKVGATDSTSGAMMANLAAIRKLAGDKKAEEFIAGLVANDTRFFGGHTDIRKAVGAGELKLGLVNHYYYFLSKAEGAPVGIVWPDQGEGQIGLIYNSTNAGILKGAPHADLARVFVDFMLSPRGQRVYAERNYEYPILKDIALAPGVPPLESFRLAGISLKLMWEELEPTRALAQKAGLP
ncbi:MAG: extracellular solute-binding protein [Anaerolineales bacterium]|nr:extracellular solute-binding protein [Anaerolineales bacterium]